MSLQYNNNNNNNKSFKALKKERKKTVSNRVDEESYHKLCLILLRERIKIGDWLESSIEDYVKKHSDENQTFTLDNFQDENFLACPAYHRPIDKWEIYLTNCPELDYKEWCYQLQRLLKLDGKMCGIR